MSKSSDKYDDVDLEVLGIRHEAIDYLSEEGCDPFDEYVELDSYVSSLIKHSPANFDYCVEVVISSDDLNGGLIPEYVSRFNRIMAEHHFSSSWKSVKKCIPMVAVCRSTYDELSCESRYTVFFALKKPLGFTSARFRIVLEELWRKPKGETYIRSARCMRNWVEWSDYIQSRLVNADYETVPIDSLHIF